MSKDQGRYKTESNQGYEPGSNNTVLKNKMGITSVHEMEALETRYYEHTLNYLLDTVSYDEKITVRKIREMHKYWLGDIYTWAGEYRTVNMSKDGFVFAACHLLEKLLIDFEHNMLNKFTPCTATTDCALAEILAISHVELILIHPFREGNGRLARLICIIMAAQAGFPLLNFDILSEQRKRKEYFSAIQQGLSANYDAMRDLFLDIIKESAT